MNGNSTFGVLVVIVLIVLVIWACVARGEGFMPERGTVMYSLGDNAYGRQQLPDYSEDVGYNLRENYHPWYQCKMQCQYETGAGRNAVCVDQCMREQTGREYRVECAKDDDCPGGDICVLGGPYSGMSHKGQCLDPREPFDLGDAGSSYGQLHADEMKGLKLKENLYLPVTCPPSDFFEENAGKCEPRFQGQSSAWAVHHQPPVERPEVWLPGSITPGYGVGQTDPFNVKTNVTIY